DSVVLKPGLRLHQVDQSGSEMLQITPQARFVLVHAQAARGVRNTKDRDSSGDPAVRQGLAAVGGDVHDRHLRRRSNLHRRALDPHAARSPAARLLRPSYQEGCTEHDVHGEVGIARYDNAVSVRAIELHVEAEARARFEEILETPSPSVRGYGGGVGAVVEM